MIEWLYSTFSEPLEAVHIQKAFIGATLTAIVSGVIGCFIVLRRMAFLSDALSHSMIAGVVAGYLVVKVFMGADADAAALMIGAVIAGLVTVSLIQLVSGVSRIKEDTAIGIMYTGIFALGGIIASRFSHYIHIHLYDYIVGMILAVQDEHLWMIGAVTVITLSMVILFFRPLQLSTFDPVMAASIGVPVMALNLMLTTCASLVVVSAVSIVGVILVIGLLITPAATAYLLCDRLVRMLWVSALFGVSSVVIGMYVSIWLGNVDPAPTIVLVGTLQFTALLIVSPRYGLIADLLRRRATASRRVMEDVLGVLRRAEAGALHAGDVVYRVDAPAPETQRAVRLLENQGLIDRRNGQVALTEAGQTEARRLMRSHRLWEAYLEHLGTPEEQIHAKAHQLEHVHDEQAVDYIDDKLGHPLRDPHGSEIPEDFVHLVPGHEVRASLLRRGLGATIVDLDRAAAELPLQPGEHVTTEPRSNDGQTWNLRLSDGRLIQLDHDQADAVTVKLDDG